jgi:hypothetical protein
LLPSRLAGREMVMPIGRYIAWVGTSLLALLFLADWYFPKSSPQPQRDANNLPIIRIASVRQPPERVVIDTSRPTIVPTPLADAAPVEPSPLQSYASTTPPPGVIDDDKKRRKGIKRQGPKVASYHPPSASPAAAAGGRPPTTPPFKVSFTDIVSGQLVKNLFNLR